LSELLLPANLIGAPILENFEIEPYRGLILVERIEDAARTIAGLELSEGAAEEVRLPRYRVLAVGGPYPLPNGTYVEINLRVDDEVCLAGANSGRGQWFKVPAPGKTKRFLVDENAIIARVKSDAPIAPKADAS
jgi:co-chaperonin GroES (HSP10)